MHEFTEKEKLILFDKRVKELLDCKFLKRKEKIKLELIPTGEQLENYFTFLINGKEPDRDSIISMLTSFRLFYMEKEPTHFYHICNILWKKAKSNEIKQRLEILKKAYTRILEYGCGWAFKINKKTIAPKHTIKAKLNSIFHSDKIYMERWNYLKSVGSGSIESNFIQYILTLIQIIVELNKIVNEVLESN